MMLHKTLLAGRRIVPRVGSALHHFKSVAQRDHQRQFTAANRFAASSFSSSSQHHKPSTGVWEIDQLATIHVDKEGLGSLEPLTFLQVFEQTARKFPNKQALCHKKDGDKTWHAYTWQQYYDTSMAFGKSLLALDLNRFDCVNIIGFNSPEWFIANNGTIAAGGVAAGIYTTNGPETCRYISHHSKARVVVVENRQQLDKYLQIAPQLDQLKAIVMWKDQVPKDDEQVQQCRVPIYTFDEFLTLGAHVHDARIHDRIKCQQPGHCCNLIYTSGTTGPPKAVMVSHDNFTWNARAVISLHDDATENERSVSFLPLSHVAAQLVDIHMPAHVGSTLYFANPDVFKGTLVDTLKEVRPTMFFGVARVWEKMMEKLMEAGAKSTGLRKKAVMWARKQGQNHLESQQYGGDLHPVDLMKFWVADAVIFRQIKKALGLDQCRFFASGAAPIADEVVNFFGCLGIPVHEIFGMSECSGPHSLNLPERWKVGSVGVPLKSTDTRVDETTRELLIKGRHVFMGYLGDEKNTRHALVNGWLHTGDMGSIDEDGFVAITGRIKELIVTAGGEKIAPLVIEDHLKAELPVLGHVMIVGDRRKYLTFVCTLRTKEEVETANTCSESSDELHATVLAVGETIGSHARTMADARDCAKWQRYIWDGMQRVNAMATSNAHRLQKFAILPTEFSIAGGELTPTLKLRRSKVLEKHARVIDAMYSETQPDVAMQMQQQQQQQQSDDIPRVQIDVPIPTTPPPSPAILEQEARI